MIGVTEKLKELTTKLHVQLTTRGNEALDLILELCKKLGKKKVLIPDQGGWIHYQKSPPKKGFELVEVKTNHGLLDLEDLKKKADPKSVLISNSMPGYFVLEDVEKIEKACKEKKCLYINDVSGSIGREEAKKGDFVFGSFGEHKPIDISYGGFLATNDEEWFIELGDSVFDESREGELLEQIDLLKEKIDNYDKLRDKVISDLKAYDILFPDKEGINVIVRFDTDDEKEKIKKYCEDNNLGFTECPRYIRINEKAISIEVKRDGNT